MAPIAPPSSYRCTICTKDTNCTHRSNKNTLDTDADADADAIALELARNELLLVSQSLEQLLYVMRKANSQQLQSLFTAARSGLSQEQILVMAEQYATEIKNAESKQETIIS